MGTIACSRSPCRGPLRRRRCSITGMLTWRFLSCLPRGLATHFLGLSLPPSEHAGPGAALTLSLAGSGARQHLPLVSPETQTSAWESWEGASPPGAHSQNFWKIWADSAVSFRTRSPRGVCLWGVRSMLDSPEVASLRSTIPYQIPRTAWTHL